MAATKRRNVKSQQDAVLHLAVDSHERGRDFLTHAEIQSMIKVARKGRHGVRDDAMLCMMFEHAYRVSELCQARLSQLDTSTSRIWVERSKGSLSTEQPIHGDTLRAIKRYLRSRQDTLPWLFVTERAEPFTRQGIYYLIRIIGQRAGLGHVHPHMLRHGCGYYLANKGYDSRLIQDYLGHRDPKHTVRYTRTAASRFECIWD